MISYDLGSSSYQWKDAYMSNNTIIGGTLNVGGDITMSYIISGVEEENKWLRKEIEILKAA